MHPTHGFLYHLLKYKVKMHAVTETFQDPESEILFKNQLFWLHINNKTIFTVVSNYQISYDFLLFLLNVNRLIF